MNLQNKLNLLELKLLSRRRLVWPLSGLRANIESPIAGQGFRDKIEIRGWALDLAGDGVTVDVLLDGNLIESIPAKIDRPDVEGYFDLKHSGVARGFRSFIPWASLKEVKANSRVELTIHKGAKRFSYGPLPVRRVETSLKPDQRSQYKNVWDREVNSEKTAMLAVAGTASKSDFFSSGETTADTLVRAMDIKASDVVLEIGCGIGRIGVPLTKLCTKWIGTDISPKMLELARTEIARTGRNNFELHELFACNLNSFRSDSVDKIYCSTVFMHLDEWDRFAYVEDSFRVLKPGGKLYVDNINLEGDIGWGIFREMASFDPASRPASISKASTEPELRTYMRRAGFVDIETFPGDHYVAALGTKPSAR